MLIVMTIAVTADIVGSRRLPDRAAAQRALDERSPASSDDLPLARAAPAPDRRRRAAGRLSDARRRDGDRCCCCSSPSPTASSAGSASGSERSAPSPSASGDIPEGPAWWAAREAIDMVHALQQRAVPSARTWVVAAPDEGATRRARGAAGERLPARARPARRGDERAHPSSDLRPLPRRDAARARERRGHHPVRGVSGARDLGGGGRHRGLPAAAPRGRLGSAA